jgi:type IV pilus biogenesis protein CpaD/CtpE
MTRLKARLSLGVVLATSLAGAAGCADRLHMTPGHGRASQAAFAAQQANPQAAGKPRPLPGFDAQEAGVVSSNYRKSLAAKDTQTRDQGLLMLAPPATGGQPYLPPASVPEQK